MSNIDESNKIADLTKRDNLPLEVLQLDPMATDDRGETNYINVDLAVVKERIKSRLKITFDLVQVNTEIRNQTRQSPNNRT